MTEYYKLAELLPREYAKDLNFVLLATAVPSILPGCPSYLSSESLPRPTRFNRESKEEEQFAQALQLSLEQQSHDDERFKMRNFQDLTAKLSLLTSSNKWVVWCSECILHIFKPKLHDHVLNIEIRLMIYENLTIMGFRDNNEIPLSINTLSDTRQVEVCFKKSKVLLPR